MIQSLISTIWEDIDHNAEAIVIVDFSFPLSDLCNSLYQRKKLPSHLHLHFRELTNNTQLRDLVQLLIQEDKIPNLRSVDLAFINSYYRRLLRANLEFNYQDKPLPPGLVITDYNDYEIDKMIVMTLRLLRVVCRYLGIPNTYTSSSFDSRKLTISNFWQEIATKFVQCFGEDRISIVVTETSHVLLVLNIIFNTWSGSMLLPQKRQVKVIPGTYITRLLPWIKN